MIYFQYLTLRGAGSPAGEAPFDVEINTLVFVSAHTIQLLLFLPPDFCLIILLTFLTQGASPFFCAYVDLCFNAFWCDFERE